MAERNDPPKDLGTVMAGKRTDMALTRTRLAAERTLDASVRTSLSMIGFGFTIYKFLQQLQGDSAADLARPHAPRNFGLALIIVGTLYMIAAIYQHIGFFKELGLDPFRRPVSLSVIIAIFIGLLGILTFVSIVANIGPI